MHHGGVPKGKNHLGLLGSGVFCERFGFRLNPKRKMISRPVDLEKEHVLDLPKPRKKYDIYIQVIG